MKIQHLMNKEASGLVTTTLELAKYEELAGHQVVVRQPNGGLIYGHGNGYDVTIAHHQMDGSQYFDQKPKILINHGEPLSSFANGISMRATVEMASKCNAFICMRKDELPLWGAIHPNTFLVRKGIDCEIYRPLPGITERLSGEPSILYYENIRGNRNPYYWLVAMQKVHSVFPNARFHAYNVTDKRMVEALQALNTNNHWWVFLRSISGPVEGPEAVNLLLNRVDIVVSALHPLYARSIEAFGAGKAFICPGYHEEGYPWTCEYDVESMADSIIACWRDYQKLDYRKWALDKHNVKDTVDECLAIYNKFV